MGYKVDVQSTVQQVTVDLKYCPIHGVLLSEGASTYTRTTEDVKDEKWTKTKWAVTRRYCKECGKQHSAPVPGVLPKEYFGTTVMSQVFCMRCLGMPFDKTQKIIHMLHGRFIEISNLIHICNTVADRCDPLYKTLLKLINLAEMLWVYDWMVFQQKTLVRMGVHIRAYSTVSLLCI